MKRARSWLAAGACTAVLLSGGALAMVNYASEDARGSSEVEVAESAADAARALRLAYGERAGEALDRAPRIEPRGGAFELRRGEPMEPSMEAPHEALEEPAGMPRPPIDEMAAEPFRVILPADGAEAIEMHVLGHEVVRVREADVYGRAERVAGAVTYARDGGRSYWTEGDDGYEEWLELEAGRAYAGRVLARWHVEGGTPRVHEDAVLIADARGATALRVTAPRAWARSGRAVDARLGVEKNAITVEVDAGGEAVLVDPLWVATGSMAVARGDFFQGHGAELLPGGGVLIAGGAGTSTALPSAERYDPVGETWSLAGSMFRPRDGHATTRLVDGRVLATGGRTRTGVSGTAEIFDPSTGTWSPVAPIWPRLRHTATLLPDGRVLVAGGYTGSSFTAAAEVFDPSTGTWSAAPPMSTPRSLHAATLLPSGRVLVTGGQTDSVYLASAELFDPSTSTWSFVPPMSIARHAHTATLLPDGRVLVVGGGPTSSTATATADLFDPSAGTWSAASAMSTPRAGHTATLLPSGRVLAAGGHTGSAVVTATAELFHPDSGTWSTAPSMALGRYAHVAVALGDGRVLLAGGSTASGLTATAELFVDDPMCGNGVLEAGESCDDGNTSSGDCCSATCAIEPADTLCRASAGACDVGEVCDGATPVCPADAFEPVGTMCRASAGACDIAETCTGSSASCPSDAFEPSTIVCRAAAGVCDVAETCTGTSAPCPSDAFEPSTTVCRAAAGVCDLAEACTGSSASCSSDVLEPSTTVCRALAGPCDVAEACTGTSAVCPSDAFELSSTVCRASVGVCDVAETCTGGAAACPADAAEPEGTACGGASGGDCDERDVCAGDVGATATCEPRFPDASVSCGTPSCTDGVATAAGSCAGAGSCEEGVTRDCAPVVCGAEVCLDACDDDADCVSGLRCVGGACVEPSDAGIDADGSAVDLDGAVVGTDGSILADGGVRSPASNGCGCAVPGGPQRVPGTALLVALAVVIAIRRRRSRH